MSPDTSVRQSWSETRALVSNLSGDKPPHLPERNLTQVNRRYTDTTWQRYTTQTQYRDTLHKDTMWQKTKQTTEQRQNMTEGQHRDTMWQRQHHTPWHRDDIEKTQTHRDTDTTLRYNMTETKHNRGTRQRQQRLNMTETIQRHNLTQRQWVKRDMLYFVPVVQQLWSENSEVSTSVRLHMSQLQEKTVQISFITKLNDHIVTPFTLVYRITSIHD